MRIITTLVATLSLVMLFGQTAWAQFRPFPSLEAECPDSSQGTYGSLQTDAAGYSGIGLIRSYGNTTATYFDGSSQDYATYSFEIREPGNYRVYFRVNTNGSYVDDSWYYQVNTWNWATMNGYGGENGWQWVGGPWDWPLDAGINTVTIANRENGLMFDKIAILPIDSPPPVGLGDPAYNCPTTYYFEAECRTHAFEGYQLDRKERPGFSDEGYIESVDDTGDVNTAKDIVFYEFETGAASYALYFRVHNNYSWNDDSWFYRVDGGEWALMNGTAAAGWNWVQGAWSVGLTKGIHSLEIRNREDGLALDKIAFVPNGAPAPVGVGGTGVNCEPFETMSDWSYKEVQEYAATHLEYWMSGTHDIQDHFDWHLRNGSGGQTQDPNTGKVIMGAGTAFLGFHRAMMNDFRRFALETNGRSWLPISVVGPTIPDSLPDAEQVLNAIGLPGEYFPRDENPTDWGIPASLTVTGTGPGVLPGTMSMDDIVHSILGDFENLDRLGRTIGAYYHKSYHQAVDGTMFFNYSPSDPIFYGWHALLDNIISNWLETPNGQAWAAANPDHPFLVEGFTGMEGWEPSDFTPTL